MAYIGFGAYTPEKRPARPSGLGILLPWNILMLGARKNRAFQSAVGEW
jgi:hypothetical protein